MSTESEPAYFLTAGLYNTLISWDSEKSEFKPELAESWKFISPTEVIFKLRDDVKFHDGKNLVSKDVVKSIKFIKEHAKFTTSMLSPILDISALNKSRIRIRLYKPDPLILRRIAYWFRIYPCSRRCSAEDSTNIALPGTGRWKYKDHRRNYYAFTAFNNNWNGDVGRDVIMKVITGANSLHSRKINADTISVFDGMPWNERLFAVRSLGLQTIHAASAYSDFGIFNTLAQDSIVTDIRIRRAINHAIDRKALVRLVYKNAVIPLPSLSLPSDDGHNDKLQVYSYDPELSERLVAEYKKEHPDKKLVLRVGMQSYGETYDRLIQFLRASVDILGIDLFVDPDYSVANQFSRHSNDIDLVLGGDPSPYAHFDFFIQNFFVAGSPFQVSRNNEIKSLLVQTQQMTSEIAANELYRKIDLLVYEEYLALPGVQYRRMVAHKPVVKFKPIHSNMELLNYIEY